MTTILEKLKENRPNLSEGSLKTYNSILKNLFKKVFPDMKLDLLKFTESKKFINYLKDKEQGNRKTYLTALTVMCPNVDEYREMMMKDGQEFNANQKLQQRTQKQTDNWVEQDELEEIYYDLEVEAKKLYKLNHPSANDIQKIQNYVMLSLLGGKFISIRRSLDWTEMTFKDVNKETDNFLDTSKTQYKFYFNVYKTQKFLNDQQVLIPIPLKKILVQWIKLLEQYYPDNKYLLIDIRGNKLNPTKLGQRLNLIFGKKASVNILRHSFITNKYKDLPALKALEEEANEMGHSLTEHLTYIKK